MFGQERTSELLEERLLLADVLDRLEGYGDVDAGVGDRQACAGRAEEFDIREVRVRALRVFDRRIRDVGAGHVRRVAREECGSVALAASHVEDSLAARPARGEVIAVPMLDPDLALGAGNETLAGEGQRGIEAGVGRLGAHGIRRSRRSARRAGCR